MYKKYEINITDLGDLMNILVVPNANSADGIGRSCNKYWILWIGGKREDGHVFKDNILYLSKNSPCVNRKENPLLLKRTVSIILKKIRRRD